MKKSLRKNIVHHQAEKVSKNLHLVRGEHKVNHSHSHAPISADEIEKLVSINPVYADRLFDIMEKSVSLEGREVELYFEAVRKEQENDELAIISQEKIATQSLYISSAIILFLIISSIAFVYLKESWIAFAIVSTVIGVVIKALMGKSEKK